MRVLIALQGGAVRRTVLSAALRLCAEMRAAVDILLVDGDEASSSRLAGLLAELGDSRRPPRLFRRAGVFHEAVAAHAGRHKEVYMVLIDSMKHWGRDVPLGILSQPVGLLGSVAAA